MAAAKEHHPVAGGKRTNDNTVGELAQKFCDVTGLGSAHVAPKAGTMKYGQGVCASNGHGEREKVLLFESLQRLLDKFCPFYFILFSSLLVYIPPQEGVPRPVAVGTYTRNECN